MNRPQSSSTDAGREVTTRTTIAFVVAIVVVGAVRFGLTVSGVTDEITRYASMTVVILAGCVYFGTRRLSGKDLLRASFSLILPYMAVELIGIGYTWATGQTTIFHAPQYSFGSSLKVHFWGHLVGGLTWEPLSLFVVMLAIRAAYAGWTSLVRPGAPEGPR